MHVKMSLSSGILEPARHANTSCRKRVKTPVIATFSGDENTSFRRRFENSDWTGSPGTF